MVNIISRILDIKKLIERTNLANEDEIKGPKRNFYQVRDQICNLTFFLSFRVFFKLFIENSWTKEEKKEMPKLTIAKYLVLV